MQGLNFTSNRRERHGKLLCDIVQDAACLNDVRLLGQRAFLGKTELHQTPEALLHGAEHRLHDIINLCVGLVEAGLAVICRFRHRSQDMFA